MRGRLWTPEEDKIMFELYSNCSTEHIANILNRKNKSVYSRAFFLGLKKSEEQLKIQYKEKVKGILEGGVKYRFNNKHTPWNKGKKGIQIGGKETQFKKGHLPKNSKYDGAISIRKDKSGKEFKHIRVSLGKWEYLHRYIWQETHGPIPPKHNIRFKDGNVMNCELSNLEMVSKSQNMALNTIQRFPSELISTIRVLSKFKKHVNEKQNS